MIRAYTYSHNLPVPGEDVQVWAAIENVGLVQAYGAEIEFCESRNGGAAGGDHQRHG